MNYRPPPSKAPSLHDIHLRLHLEGWQPPATRHDKDATPFRHRPHHPAFFTCSPRRNMTRRSACAVSGPALHMYSRACRRLGADCRCRLCGATDGVLVTGRFVRSNAHEGAAFVLISDKPIGATAAPFAGREGTHTHTRDAKAVAFFPAGTARTGAASGRMVRHRAVEYAAGSGRVSDGSCGFLRSHVSVAAPAIPLPQTAVFPTSSPPSTFGSTQI